MKNIERFNKYFDSLIEILPKADGKTIDILTVLLKELYEDAIEEEKKIKIEIEKDGEIKRFLSIAECGEFLGSRRTQVDRAKKKGYKIKGWKIIQ